jgi:hypothetical protein
MNDELLLSCYREISNILGDRSEPWQSVKLIEQYRRYWRPKKVNVVLLAESHVFTSDGDRACRLKSLDELPDCPDSYARFVYCLAYGEQTLTSEGNHPSRAHGTPQFWKILYSCINEVDSKESFSPILKSGTRAPSKRIRNKIDLLLELRIRGIWLVDASIIALYNKGVKPDNEVFDQVIKTSWLGYTRQLIQDANPRHVIIVGKGVAKNVGESVSSIVGKDGYTVIPQPQARQSAEQNLNNFRMCHDVCSYHYR